MLKKLCTSGNNKTSVIYCTDINQHHVNTCFKLVLHFTNKYFVFFIFHFVDVNKLSASLISFEQNLGIFL